METKKWHQKPLGIIVLLILFFPAGLFLMWKYANWSSKTKWIISGIFIFIILTNLLAGENKQNPSNAASKPTVQAQTQSTKPDILPTTITSQPSKSLQSLNQLVKVTRVVDGDTIEIEGGQRVRYIGIDTPETVDPRKAVQCFGKEASTKNKELVEGKQVRLEKDISETDKYGRLLRYVWVGDIFVNDYLVRQGYAHSSSYPPDIKYQNQFTQAQNEAKSNYRGLWESCDVTKNQNEPTNAPNVADNANNPAQSGNCLIKGNISSSGEKIYHVQGCQSYSKTVIDTGAGERWFCSEEEAVQAGWRKALNC